MNSKINWKKQVALSYGMYVYCLGWKGMEEWTFTVYVSFSLSAQDKCIKICHYIVCTIITKVFLSSFGLAEKLKKAHTEWRGLPFLDNSLRILDLWAPFLLAVPKVAIYDSIKLSQVKRKKRVGKNQVENELNLM